MKCETACGATIDSGFIEQYFRRLVNRFFKILPLREAGEMSLSVYLKDLQVSMLGCGGLISAIHNDADFLVLLTILQYFLDYPDCELSQLRREIFNAISICNKLADRYSESEAGT